MKKWQTQMLQMTAEIAAHTGTRIKRENVVSARMMVAGARMALSNFLMLARNREDIITASARQLVANSYYYSNDLYEWTRRQKTHIEGISMNDRLYGYLTPVKWCMVLIFLGLCFIGGNFCNFCPMVSVSPILAGISTSLYFSGFLMVFVLIGSFFKRRLFCSICPLGYLVGLLHKLSLFRIKKDCTACTECGACYEACPMGIKMIYTERGKADVTDANCIMCGECIRCCPEDNALKMTCAGIKLYTASRKKVMSGYEKKESEAGK